MTDFSDVIDGQRFTRTEHVGCPLCGKNYPSRVIPCQFGMKASVAVCNSCRIGFQTPRPPPEATLAYMNWRWRSKDSYVDDRTAQMNRGSEQLGFVTKTVSRDANTLLDFGAGAGSFVKLALDAGYDAVGVERSPTAREKAKTSYGVDLLAELPDKQFDVITLWDVIEHLRSPQDLLTKLWHSLAPGGTIFLETGNWESWERLCNRDRWHVYLFDHHFYFSPSSLQRITKAAGYGEFRLLDVNRVPPFGLKQFFKMPPYTVRTWLAYMQAKILWPRHGNIGTMIAVARKPA
jgi:SAM-dependent methyltransferase